MVTYPQEGCSETTPLSSARVSSSVFDLEGAREDNVIDLHQCRLLISASVLVRTQILV